MYHFDRDMCKLESDPYCLKEDILCRDHQDNPLINDFGMCVLSGLYTFQNLREAFLVKEDTDIAIPPSFSTVIVCTISHGSFWFVSRLWWHSVPTTLPATPS